MAPEHVEMTGTVVVRDEVHPRLKDDAAVTVRPHGIFDRRDDLSVRDAERVYVRTGQEAKPQSSAGPIRQTRVTGGRCTGRGQLGVHGVLPSYLHRAGTSAALPPGAVAQSSRRSPC